MYVQIRNVEWTIRNSQRMTTVENLLLKHSDLSGAVKHMPSNRAPVPMKIALKGERLKVERIVVKGGFVKVNPGLEWRHWLVKA